MDEQTETCIQGLEKCLNAFNELKNQKLNYLEEEDTYELANKIDRLINNVLEETTT